MVSSDYKKRASELIKKAQQKGLIKKYSDFCETKEAKEFALSKEDVIYYTSKSEGAKQMKNFKIGDIVFVAKYQYKVENLEKIIFQ